MISKEFIVEDESISPELQALIDVATQTGNKMAASKTHRLQLYMPKLDRTAVGEDIKPDAKLWTSTAINRGGDVGYTSEWVEWCYYNMPRWVSPKGSLYQIQPGAKILNLGSDAAAIKIAKLFNRDYKLDSWDRLSTYPSQELSKYIDAIRYPARLSGSFRSRMDNKLMGLWDVESTAWYRTDSLRLVGEVKIEPRAW